MERTNSFIPLLHFYLCQPWRFLAKKFIDFIETMEKRSQQELLLLPIKSLDLEHDDLQRRGWDKGKIIVSEKVNGVLALTGTLFSIFSVSFVFCFSKLYEGVQFLW